MGRKKNQTFHKFRVRTVISGHSAAGQQQFFSRIAAFFFLLIFASIVQKRKA
jgi:hypothetical protein